MRTNDCKAAGHKKCTSHTLNATSHNQLFDVGGKPTDCRSRRKNSYAKEEDQTSPPKVAQRGIRAERNSPYPSTTHCTSTTVAWNADCRAGKATFTTV